MESTAEQSRNVCIIGPISHGKTSLARCLGLAAGRPDFPAATEPDRHFCTTTGVNAASLRFESPSNPTDSTIINLTDTPGHLELLSEVGAALRIADGALLSVDCKAGICRGTTKILTTCLVEGVHPVLVLCKMDLIIADIGKDCYARFSQQIAAIHDTVEAHSVVGDKGGAGKGGGSQATACRPEDGGVIFCSAPHSWAFTLQDFAEQYAVKFGVATAEMQKRLWGDHFFDAQTKRWARSGLERDRGFNLLVLDPIRKIAAACANGQMEKLQRMLRAIDVDIDLQDWHCCGGRAGWTLLHHVLSTWLPAARTLVRVIHGAVPSPLAAQAQRHPAWLCDTDRERLEGVRKCDPTAPLLVYVSKFLWGDAGEGRCMALGRVFSGTLRAGEEVLVSAASDQLWPCICKRVGPAEAAARAEQGRAEGAERGEEEGEAAEENGGEEESVVMEERREEKARGKVSRESERCLKLVRLDSLRGSGADQIEAGGMCAILGLEHFLASQGFITQAADGPVVRRGDSKGSQCLALPSVLVGLVTCRVGVEPAESAGGLPAVREGMQALARVMVGVRAEVDETGEHVIYATGPMQLGVAEWMIRRLCSVDLRISEPVICYRETVSRARRSSASTAQRRIPDDEVCMSKSANRHSRLWVSAEALDETLSAAIEQGRIHTADAKTRSRQLAETYGWRIEEARRVFAFGPHESGCNVVVDRTASNDNFAETKPWLATMFQWVSREGVLASEPLRGVCLNIVDVSYVADAIHRGAGQVLPMARRAMFGSMLLASPRVLEPMVVVELVCPVKVIGALENYLEGKGGQVVGVEGILFAIVQCVHDEMSNTDVAYEANRVGRGGRRGGQRGVCPTASGCVCRGKTGTFGRSLLACHASRGGRAIPKPPFPNPHFCTFRSGFRAGPERICRLESGGRGSDGGRDGAGLGQGGPEQERAQARRPSDRAIPRQELKLGSFTVFPLSSVDMGSDCSGQKCCCFPVSCFNIGVCMSTLCLCVCICGSDSFCLRCPWPCFPA